MSFSSLRKKIARWHFIADFKVYGVILLFTAGKKVFIALDKANWSQPKMEKSCIYICNTINIIFCMHWHVLHNLQWQFSGTQVFIFDLKSAVDSIVLYSLGARLHNLGPRKKDVSMPYFVVRIYLDLKCEVARREHGFSINSKTLFMSSGDKPFLTLNILVPIFCRFLWSVLSPISNS